MGPPPSTNPSQGLVRYSVGGVQFWRGSDGQIDSIRTTQPPQFIFKSPIDSGVDSAAAALGSIEYVAFWVTENNRRIDRVCFEVVNSSGNVCVSIMDDDGSGNNPGTRLSTSGSVACPAAGSSAAVAVPEIIVQPGKYYAALACDNETATFRWVSGLKKINGLVKARYQGSGFPIPAVETAPGLESSGNAFAIYAGHS